MLKLMLLIFCFQQIFSLDVQKTYIFKPTTETNLVPIIEDGFGIEKGGKIFLNITFGDHDIGNSKIVFMVIPQNQYVYFLYFFLIF